tara:strand:- start:364 stop:597 length:234 start_codon:yes stop_codon:yes gene_type:complete
MELKEAIREEIRKILKEIDIRNEGPKMSVDPDAEYVSDVISRLGAIGRRATGSNVKRDVTKALKVLQNLRSSIQVGR